MNQRDWLSSSDPTAMLAYLLEQSRPSERRLRLWACACCRQAWGALDAQSRRAVEAAESYADGIDLGGSDKQLIAFLAQQADDQQFRYHMAHDDNEAYDIDDDSRWGAMLWVQAAVADDVPESINENDRPLSAAVPQATQAALLREIVGNPWRPWMREADFVAGAPLPGQRLHIVWGSWLAWNDATVPRLAQAAYESRGADGLLDPERLAVLADGLEESGCQDEPCPYCKDADFGTGDLGTPMMGGKEPYARRAKAYFNEKCVCKGTRTQPHPLLAHLRSPGPHCRGCFVVDLLTGKE